MRNIEASENQIGFAFGVDGNQSYNTSSLLLIPTLDDVSPRSLTVPITTYLPALCTHTKQAENSSNIQLYIGIKASSVLLISLIGGGLMACEPTD